MQILQPLAIQHIGLAARHVMHMLRIDQMNFDTLRLQDLTQRDPVHSRRLHRHRVDTAGLEPIGQPMEIFCKAGKRPDRIAVPVGRNRDKYFLWLRCLSPRHWVSSPANSYPTDDAFSVQPWRAPPDQFWRQRARYAK